MKLDAYNKAPSVFFSSLSAPDQPSSTNVQPMPYATIHSFGNIILWQFTSTIVVMHSVCICVCVLRFFFSISLRLNLTLFSNLHLTPS